MFIGPKLSTVFASRWKALAWSAGVLLTAYCTVPSPDRKDADSSVVDPALVSGLIAGAAPAQAESHPSPWAITSPTPAPGR